MPEIEAPIQKDLPAPGRPALLQFARGRSMLRIVLEVVLISTGVFLGLAGEQWRQDREQRALGQESLRRFRAEIQGNRKAVDAVKDYHAGLLKTLRAYLAKDHKTRNTADVRIDGLQFVYFEHTAWDLAVATQALTYIDSDLAFALSRIYNVQDSYSERTRGMSQAMYLLPFRENFDAFAGAAEAYYGDASLINPAPLAMYDEVLQLIDRALGESSRH
jgi:hypothetical protein